MFEGVLITPLYLTFLGFNILFQAYSHIIYAYLCLLRFTEVYSELWHIQHIQVNWEPRRIQAYSKLITNFHKSKYIQNSTKLQCLAKITAATNFTSSILDVWQNSECASASMDAFLHDILFMNDCVVNLQMIQLKAIS